ncbi:hypothetical protein [Streptomyces flavidovirens]|uniref:Uncharacterized protein n=1 Tax=Streptomyces flavidovirens TaxID=67298 RepID=A0ABW6RG62_9ACTN
MGTKRKTAADDALTTGRLAAQHLAAALKAAGFTLPSLTGDFPVMERAMVQLGGLCAEEALRLAEWVRERAR